ncbi:MULTISPECIES: type II secretion system protein GspM [unclassified Serratia (in: enterobacteria)]|uniref:type II secretion system protein GspM n=1 Tax=unclassified Serratia (in: enterobacteria) TaxID=2647522 RepID=UPI0027EC961D|nr:MULTISPECIES: type II secretion system protein GspM [unclassified Serratia (in: enterobacteria)]MDQ7100821.1 type II secretion system protein GspM [Serratia sp. MF2]MDQ7105979.1 type II secretion system protein GspM [Serratia sp. MF1(2023)]
MNIGWRDKALRRAVLLSLLLLAACGYCLYQFSQAQKSAQRLAALQGQARVIQQLQARLPPDAAAREQLPELLRQSAQAFRVPIVALTESDAQMQVGLPPVPFESLLSWLAALQREHGIRVLALAVERAEQAPGVVQVNLLRVTTQPSM